MDESRKLALLAAAAECSQEEYDEINEHIQNLPLKDQLLMSKVIASFMDRVTNVELYIYQKYFLHWKDTDNWLKKHLKIGRDRLDVISVLRTSKRGQRSIAEKEILLRYMSQHCACLPYKLMTSYELDYLCNNVEFHPVIGWSLIFLQGDFGNCYYMIATGSVDLYLEQSRDREMVLSRDYGNLRGKPFVEGDLKRKEILGNLGKNIITLQEGGGFGEYAILSTTQKLRSCAAVSTNDDTLLFVLDEKVYNEVLRKHHFRQRNLTNCIRLLQEIPVIQSYSHSKISQLAYHMNYMEYSGNKKIIAAGNTIDKVLVVLSGEIRAYKPNEKEKEKKRNVIVSNTYVKKIENRLPRLAVAIIGRGKLIGNTELQAGETRYSMSYESNYSGCEVFEIPADVYIEYFCIPEIRELPIYKTLETYTKKKENEQATRHSRSRAAMKSMVTNPAITCQSVKVDLLSVLHNMVDIREATSFSLHTSTNAWDSKPTISMFDNDDNMVRTSSRATSRPSSRATSPTKRNSLSPTSRLDSSGSPSRVTTNFTPPSREQPSSASPRKTAILTQQV